jgi:putative ABC transport system permease protein
MYGLWHDVRLALRTLRQHKGLSLAALLSLALGLGANAALFSVAYGVLMRPLPYPGADRLVRLGEVHPGATAAFRGSLLTDRTYDAWSRNPETVEGIAVFSRDTVVDTSGDRAERLPSASVSPSLFHLLRARPSAGRLLVADDAAEGAPPVAVISEGLLRERFGGDPSAALGRTLVLDGVAHQIVGVAAPGFYFPDREVRVWTPYEIPLPGGGDSIRLFAAVARLAPGASPAQAAAEGTAAARSVKRPPIVDAIFGKGGPVEVRVRTLLDEMTGRVRPALLVLSVGVGFVLLICCANVANLLLSRGIARSRELAVRTTLGAGRLRVIRQLLAESLVLTGLGGLLGLGLCQGLLAALPRLAPADFPRLDDVRLDGRVLAFAALVTLSTALLAGLLPALRAARRDPLPGLRDGTGGAVGARSMRLGGTLLVAEAALAVMLLVGAGLLIQSYAELVAVNPGYDPGRALVVQVDLGGQSDSEGNRQLALDLAHRVGALPGVEAAGVANMAPLGRSTAIRQLTLPASVTGGEPVTARALGYAVTPGYAEALSLRLLHGRFFEPEDLSAGVRPLLVNEEFVRSYLSDGRPVVGRRLEMGDSEKEARPSEIVGVVGNVLHDGLDGEAKSAMYSLPGPKMPPFFYLVVRTSGDPGPFVPTLRSVAAEVAPTAGLEVATLASRVSASVSQPRFAAATLATLAFLALALAATGLFGVLSYNVARRRREMGVRGALGADRGAIVGLVLRQGLVVIGAGLALGLVGAAALARLLASLLFGVTPFDAVAFILAPAVLLVVALAACLLPAWRAASVPPTEALRAE